MWKKYTPYFIIIILLFVLGWGYTVNRNQKAEIAIANQNITALNDSLIISKTKNGNLIADKGVLIAEKDNLYQLNSELAEEVKKIKGDVVRLTNTVIELSNQNPIILDDTIFMLGNDSILVKWQKHEQFDKYNFRTIMGETLLQRIDSNTNTYNSNTILTTNSIGLSLTTGLREINGKLRIFVTSAYPGFSVTKLNGAEIDPKDNPIYKNFVEKKKPWGIGVQVGYGFNNKGVSPFVGVGVSYNFIRF